MQSTDDCLENISELLEALALSGTHVANEDVMMIALEGLGSEYESFVTSVTTNPANDVSFRELQGMLSDQERHTNDSGKNQSLLSVNIATAATDGESS